VRRAVATTARLADQRGILRPLEARLEQADLRLSASEALFFFAAAVVLVVLVGLALGGPLVALIVLIFAGLLPAAALNFLAERRRKAFSSQLPDTLMLLASSLRAGYSLMQGLEAVSTEADDPMGRELRRVVLESRLGRPLEDSLDDTAKRMGSPDFDWVVMAIKIQREVGGNLAELLTTVADTMIARERLRREVSALTAEGKLSAIVLVALPVIIAGVMYVLNPAYISILFASTMGKAMLLGAVVVATAGFFWMQKMIKVEI
jgi:tight adherence protein B